MLQHRRQYSHLEDVLLDRVLGNQTVNVDVTLLTDSVRSRHSLEIVLRVPIAIEDDDRVGCAHGLNSARYADGVSRTGLKIDAKAAGAS